MESKMRKQVGGRQGEGSGWGEQNLIPWWLTKEQCLGLTLGLFAGLLLEYGEQSPVGIVRNKCIVIAWGAAGPISPGLQMHHFLRVFPLESDGLQRFNLLLLSPEDISTILCFSL